MGAEVATVGGAGVVVDMAEVEATGPGGGDRFGERLGRGGADTARSDGPGVGEGMRRGVPL